MYRDEKVDMLSIKAMHPLGYSTVLLNLVGNTKADVYICVLWPWTCALLGLDDALRILRSVQAVFPFTDYVIFQETYAMYPECEGRHLTPSPSGYKSQTKFT